MAKSNQKNSTYLILIVALVIAGVGYFIYRSLLTSPDVNIIVPDRRYLPSPGALESPNLNRPKRPNSSPQVPPSYR